ncbi:MAG TPA: SIS domain-containing protein [Planctomycetota bacterium]|nr:SIS domain-containing protein [Planctomycetota bacterium]
MTPTARRQLDDLAVRHPALALLLTPLAQAVELIAAAARAGGTLLTCGNGGSASDSEHIAGELVKGFMLRRELPPDERARFAAAGIPAASDVAGKLQRGVRTISLTSNGALISAIANDIDPTLVFAQQVYVHGRPGDVVIGLSTSGNSANVVAALQVARACGLKTIGFTGAAPAAMDAWCDVAIKAPARETPAVQELHLPLYHALCVAVEYDLFGPGAAVGQRAQN